MADCKHTLPPGSHTFVCTVTPPPYACSFCEMERLREENGELQQALEMATGPHCSSCGNAIDPDVCHCGDSYDGHDPERDGHSPVAMGCVCGYAEPNWKALATSRGEYMWKQRAANARLMASSGPTVADLEDQILRHSTTDLGIAISDARQLRAERDRMRPVYEAAKAWRQTVLQNPMAATYPQTQKLDDELDDAIDEALAKENANGQ